MSNKRNQESWNHLSSYYQVINKISLEDVHYGPFAPGEKELCIIENVIGLDVLELGCGGGQNAIVLAKWGAKSVTALDQSEKQLEHARQLAKVQDVKIKFLKGNMEDLSMLEDNSFDLIVSSHAMNYVEDLQQVFVESARVLRKGGRIVTCMGHPISFVIWDALEEESLDKVNNYFSKERMVWDWIDEHGTKLATFESTSYRFEQIINYLIFAGLRIERVLEPPGYSAAQIENMGLEAVPYRWDHIDHRFITINQRIPFSLIVSAIKL
ncbi:MAG: class I SAM-dependent methyltransferase [Candidatus Hermodarchaeota archaeon]